jgi:hypothetical protein
MFMLVMPPPAPPVAPTGNITPPLRPAI